MVNAGCCLWPKGWGERGEHRSMESIKCEVGSDVAGFVVVALPVTLEVASQYDGVVRELRL